MGLGYEDEDNREKCKGLTYSVTLSFRDEVEEIRVTSDNNGRHSPLNASDSGTSVKVCR